MKLSLTDRLEVTTHRGTVRLLVGDLVHPDEPNDRGPSTLAMSPAHARLLAKELEDAALVAELDDRETLDHGPSFDARRTREAMRAMFTPDDSETPDQSGEPKQ